ncbi:hypothetical protein FQN50_001095 [Emmonsiellopsis sp. PD_5]|nr:hypothetical protein FQN50_001095 [Emmonsiellopsis sp. PD_5]
MDGDLSLSQSFGGLRIANPDDSSVRSPEKTSNSSAAQSHPPQPRSPSRAEYQQPIDHANPTYTNPVHLAPGPADVPSQIQNNRLSLPYGYQNQGPQQYSQYPAPIAPGSSNSPRPTSTYYAQPLANGSSSAIAPREGYRLRTESSISSASDNQSRTDARGGSAALQAGVPVRDGSHSDRSYKQAQFHAGSGPLPPRRSSRTTHNNGSALSASPYGSEGGVLSNTDDWQDRGAAIGVRQDIDANGKPVSRYVKKGVRDFSFGRTLGEGSYSTVVAATDRQTLKEYAIKILDKRHIIKEKKVKYVNIEKDTLNRLTDHPGVVRLYYTFQDERSLYFVLDLASGGELLGVLKRMSTFDEECTRFYGAQILDTIDYMHKRGVIHRDLKPENVLLDNLMHVKITDFGTAKILDRSKRKGENSSGIPPMESEIPEQERANSFVGTAEYVSPELLTDKNAYKASDLWAFGCIIYQLLAGRPPFKAANEYQTFQKIVGLDYEFPAGFPAVARDLVERLLVLDPSRRLQMEHIKNHEFFDGIAWGRGLWSQKAPRLKPYVPPPPEPIRLNGSSNDDSFPPNITSNNMGLMPAGNSGNARPFPRLVTDLPPPSQLDIEWSPVLTRTNERILKMGNLVVLSSPAPHNQHGKGGTGESEAPKKFSRFFGGATTKKRQRLVMVTSAGRIIIVPAGGEDKKPKMDISLLAPGTQFRSTTDAKGNSSWVVDTRDKHYVFEDSKQSSAEVAASALSTQEWMDTLDRAKEMATFQSMNNSSYGDDAFRDLSSGVSSHANTIDHSDDFSGNVNGPAPNTRATLIKHQGPGDSESIKGKKRFSRRHSKNGLSAVF